MCKTFNPILGETYEMSNHQGITFIAEQVSLHPPMGVAQGENNHFTYNITSKLNIKFLGNLVEVYPVGRTRVTLKKSGVVLELVPPLIKINNLLFGRSWVDSFRDMVLTNLTTGDKVVLYLQPREWFGHASKNQQVDLFYGPCVGDGFATSVTMLSSCSTSWLMDGHASILINTARSAGHPCTEVSLNGHGYLQGVGIYEE